MCGITASIALVGRQVGVIEVQVHWNIFAIRRKSMFADLQKVHDNPWKLKEGLGR